MAEAEAAEAGKLRFNQFYFPGWEIKVDKRKIDFDYLSDTESYGLPIFDIDEGKHQILAEFKSTNDRKIADSLSLISVILLLILLCKLLVPLLFKIKKFS